MLVRIRDNAESIAFYGGEDVESKEVSSRLSRVIDNRKDINKAQRNLEFFTTPYHYLIQVVPIAVVAPQCKRFIIVILLFHDCMSLSIFPISYSLLDFAGTVQLVRI